MQNQFAPRKNFAPVLMNLALGLWVLATPVLFVYLTAVPTATWNHVLVGLGVMAMAIVRAWGNSGPWASWVNVVLGVWLAVSPWVLGYAHAEGYAAPGLIAGNDVVTGLIIAATAVLAAFYVRSTHRGAVFASAMPDHLGRPEHDTYNDADEADSTLKDR